jgi:hypothetical protein
MLKEEDEAETHGTATQDVVSGKAEEGTSVLAVLERLPISNILLQ